MTNHWVDIRNADVILTMGGNPAEAHPVGFRWVMEAREHNNARLVVVDPRFNRTAAVADYYAEIRTGTDIAFLGGLINYLIGQLVLVTGLTGTDRFLGMVFGAARGALLVVVAVGLLSLAPVEGDAWWRESTLIPHFLLVADWSKNFILGLFGR